MTPSPALFRRTLARWYRRHGRHDLPWRGAFDPYAVLVSEFMLQQTTVATVLPYYERFQKKFPTLARLAQAPLGEVLALWSGLGYYARARHLHAAAQRIMADHAGRLPGTRPAVEALPGVGPYTAGALLSFAHDRPEALVDGNVIRVLARLYGVTGNTRRPRTVEKIWALARGLVPPGGARHFNSALLDFGATVCRPRAPDCPACPFKKVCWARRRGREESLPRRGPAPPRRALALHAAAVERRGRRLLVQRPAGGLYGGLWELPTVEGEDPAPGFRRRGLVLGALVGTVRHTLSHRDVTLRVWRARAPAFQGGTWWTVEQMRTLPVSSLTRRALALGEEGRPRP